jgi:cytochrome oxidase Cu insertion factor (SCO1/SenC/PrrC family)
MAEGGQAPGVKRSPPRLARHPLVWIAVIALAPIVASYTVYYFFPRTPAANYGTLLSTAPVADVEGMRSDGAPFRLDELRGRWVLLALGDGDCDAGCERRLYATRQARTMQGKDQDRIVRVFLFVGDAKPAAGLLPQQPGLIVVWIPNAVGAKLPAGTRSLYLVDPLGNFVLSYPADPDIKGIARDLTRLLKASQIG